MTIKYTITLLSDWHTGSGLTSGADADAVVIKDDKQLPYIPGKTLKGLFSEALEEMLPLQSSKINENRLKALFGYEIKDDKGNVIETVEGSAFFKNAELSKADKDSITPEMTPFLYKRIASTQIEENGVAKGKSLRNIEVCIPLTLEGEIQRVQKTDEEIFKLAFQWIRYLGLNRNRGLGRCKIELKSIS
jgi:CRISPR/Cas system CSM-associated protein Csm3 (group 7 of RAMP superfamily)